MELKIYINSRDELVIVNLNNLAYLQACGNYTEVAYIGGSTMTIALGLSKIESLIAGAYAKEQRSPFIRVGRSLLINRNYLQAIYLLRSTLILSDFQQHTLRLEVSKNLLRALKSHLQGNSQLKLTENNAES